jgi:hypothetical protein
MKTTAVEWWLQMAAGVIAATTVVAAIIALVLQLTRCARLQEEIISEHREAAEIATSTASTELSLRRESEKAQQLVADVAEELKQRDQTLEVMADVLAKVKVLQQQRDAFELKRSEIAEKMSKLDNYYFRAGAAAPAAKLNPLP